MAGPYRFTRNPIYIGMTFVYLGSAVLANLAWPLVLLPVVLIAGWWYARNLQLYGELFGLDTMVAIAGPRAMTLSALIPEFDGFRYSYWALFGAVNIVTFPLAYVIFDLFTLISVVGLIVVHS
jgi:protein-S-isoprenylcysteine O-methyltransferase Ste14